MRLKSLMMRMQRLYSAQSSFSELGVLYIVWGSFDVDILLRSIRSVRNCLKLPVCLAGEGFPSVLEKSVDIYVPFDSKGRDLHSKDCMYNMSPFEVTLFLDLDTIVLGNLDFGFEMAQSHGLSLVLAPAFRVANYYLSLPDISCGDLIVYNTGVIFFKKTKAVREVFDKWRFYNEHYQLACDQPGLALSLYATKFNPFVLPRTWNFRVENMFGRLHIDGHGPIKIWHSYKGPPNDLEFTNSKAPWAIL